MCLLVRDACDRVAGPGLWGEKMLLDELLDGLDVRVSAFAICEVRREASLVIEDDKAASVHYVLSGGGYARSMTGWSAKLEPHTVMIAPPGTCLVVSCERSSQFDLPTPDCRPLPGGWEWATVGEGPPGVTLACGAIKATLQHAAGLFDHLRTPLSENVADDANFREPFLRLLDELAAPIAGTRALTEVLMKQCMIALLRRHSESDECRVPWLLALQHPQLGKAISAILDRPESHFSLQQLADIAGMSRSSFAEQFREAFGRTAFDFLNEVRLRRAAGMLNDTDLPVKTIAARVGFASRSHFSRAFKNFSGIDPAHFRADKSRKL